METRKYTQFHKKNGPGVLLSLGLLVAIYSQWTDGGLWRITAAVCAVVLVIGYTVAMLRNPDKS